MIKKNLSDFITESKLIHGEKYNYSLVNYVNNKEKVIIICPLHGKFLQSPSKHINLKQGCKKCGRINASNIQRKNIKNFISESNKIHNFKYDYSLVDYKNFSTKIKIICPEHGVFEQTPGNHISGKGCKYCGGTTLMDKNLFIYKANKIHNFKYDYSLVDYKNSFTKIKIICPNHGIFEQTPNNHLSKEQGCFECLNRVFNTETFVKKSKIIHNDKYDYSLVNYTNNVDKIKIVCPIHGEFNQSPQSHLQGNGCPSCGNINSKKEKEILSFIKSLDIETKENERSIIPPNELDIFIPSHNIAIEFNGLYWHSNEFLDKNYHLNKTISCEKINIKLIQIFEDEWDNKKEIVMSRLKNIFGLTKNKIFARKCEIKEISSKESKNFINKNHIQGNAPSTIKIGLFFKEKLVSVMTFGKRPMFNSNEYEIIRFCNILDTIVVGGAEKLLKFFIKKYNPKEIITYADRRWSNGNLYEKLKFTFIKNTPPNFYYILDKKRYNRLKFQKHKLINEGFDKTKTESEIMIERGIKKIYDCGNKKYILKF